MRRRAYLAGLGTAAVAGLAGCSTLDRLRNEESERLEQSALADWSPTDVVVPSSLPVELPETLREHHEVRTRALLEAVPTDPEIPNAVVRSDVREDREAVLADVSAGSDADRTTEVLEDWRRTRGDAAELHGTYRAATGADDATAIAGRRESVREQLATVRTSFEYVAATPLEAVLVSEPIEGLLRDSAERSRPEARYPEDPVTDVERAGDVWRTVELAEAALQDATAIRDTHREALTDGSDHRYRLIEGARDLEYAVERTRSERLAFDPRDDPADVFGFELGGLDRELFEVAARHLRFRVEDPRSHRRDGRYGTAIMAAGRALASIAAMDAVVRGIRNGDLPDEQTRQSLTTSASRAAAAIEEATTDAEFPFLAAGLLEPALSAYRSAVQSVGEYYDPHRAAANFRFAALAGAAAVDASSYVADRLAVKSD